jgi:hypothetical protein
MNTDFHRFFLHNQSLLGMHSCVSPALKSRGAQAKLKNRLDFFRFSSNYQLLTDDRLPKPKDL